MQTGQQCMVVVVVDGVDADDLEGAGGGGTTGCRLLPIAVGCG